MKPNQTKPNEHIEKLIFFKTKDIVILPFLVDHCISKSEIIKYLCAFCCREEIIPICTE